jgi:hypothetical protein
MTHPQALRILESIAQEKSIFYNVLRSLHPDFDKLLKDAKLEIDIIGLSTTMRQARKKLAEIFTELGTSLFPPEKQEYRDGRLVYNVK